MAKRSAAVRTTFNILNVKLRMPEAKEAKQDDYIGLLTSLKTRHAQALINPTLGVIMKRCIVDRVGGNVIIYGIITRFTPLINGKLLNLENPDEEENDQDGLPKNRVPNPKDVAFFFTPQNHRLAISKRGGGLTIKQAQQYFEKAFAQVKKTGQLVDVDIEQSGNTFKEILEAPKLKRLEVIVTYSNNDLYDETAGYVDQTMKSAHMQQLIIAAVSDGSPEGIDLDKIPFLKGTFQLAQSNGRASATIVDGRSPKRGRIVQTEDHPREEVVNSDIEGNILRDMYAKLMSLFPRG
jgi:hypothetical protein